MNPWALIYASVPCLQPSVRLYNADLTSETCWGHHNQTMHWEKERAGVSHRDTERTRNSIGEKEQRSLCHFLCLSWDRPSLLKWPCSFSITLCCYVCVQLRQYSVHGQSLSLLPPHLLFSTSYVFTPFTTLFGPPLLGSVRQWCHFAYPISPLFRYQAVSYLLNISLVYESGEHRNNVSLIPPVSPQCLLLWIYYSSNLLLSLCTYLCGQLSALAFILPLLLCSVFSFWLCIVTLISYVSITPL